MRAFGNLRHKDGVDVSMKRLTARLVALLVLWIVPVMHARAPATPTGHWVGTLDTVHPDGSVDPDQLYLTLDAAKPSASAAGNDPAHLSPASQATITGNTVTLTIPVNPAVTVQFNLTLQGDHLRGPATGIPGAAGARVVIDAVRADAAWHPSTPVAHAPDTLATTVANLDRKLFTAYNTCDLTTLGNLVSADLEFYHDKTGLAVGREPFVTAIKNNICGKTERELVPGSLEVHRLNTYGALEIGSHRFIHPGHPEIPTGEAKFAMLWRYSISGWQLTRVISYDHAAASK